MAAVWDIFWCKVFFKEYIKHYRKMTDEQIVKDVRQSMDDLEELVSDTDTFGSHMVRWAQERADEPFAMAARENGKKGGRPRKNKTTADASTREGEDERDHRGDTVTLESSTSANHYGVAPHREAGDVSATDSNNSEARQIQARESRRTDGHSLRVGNVARPPVRSLRLPTWDEFTAFIDAQGLDYTDAREWYEMTVVDRDGKDRYGNEIGNWKAACRKFCDAKQEKRRSA